MSKHIDIFKLRDAWRIDGHTDKEICELIGIDPKTLTKKFNGTIKPSISATQFAVICEYIEEPMDMFYVKER